MSKVTKGYAAYVAKFGDNFEELESVPWQVMPCHGQFWQAAIPFDERYGALLWRCAQESRRVTAKEFVDLDFLQPDGVYRFAPFGVETDSYEEFLAKSSKLVFNP